MISPVILSGGSGTRLWPISRESRPKQLQPLIGGDDLLQDTLKRLAGLPVGAPIVVSNEEYRFVTAEQLRELGLAAWTLLLEPLGRNTAPALTVAALYACRDGNDPGVLGPRRRTTMSATPPRFRPRSCAACPGRRQAGCRRHLRRVVPTPSPKPATAI